MRVSHLQNDAVYLRKVDEITPDNGGSALLVGDVQASEAFSQPAIHVRGGSDPDSPVISNPRSRRFFVFVGIDPPAFSRPGVMT